jgi:glycosyltransferase involved in cell wall biosynthesis
MKKCIFYLPYKLDKYALGARMIRPRKMIKAFEDIGYDVFIIEGVSSERRKRIKELKRRISRGERYDFMYTESHTEPTLLTDPSHLPTHPFLDFGFFKYIRQHGIRIGLFYCDRYWKFDSYGTTLPIWKKKGALLNYQYDILQYKKYLNKFYIVDKRVCSYLAEEKLTAISKELPPGADNISLSPKTYKYRDFNQRPLTIFYVGGLGGHYQIEELLKAVYLLKNVKLIICCRKEEWEKEAIKLNQYLCESISIIHKNSSELEPYYNEADLCSILFKNDYYVDMAKPFKAYEYLAHEIPVLSTKGTAIGEFVQNNGIGWNIEFDSKAICQILNSILEDPTLLDERIINCRKTKESNLWTCRAKQVVDDLAH